MFQDFNQPTITNAYALMEHTKKQEKLKAEQEAIKAKEKAEENAFRKLQINLSIVAIIISVIIGVASIYVAIN